MSFAIIKNSDFRLVAEFAQPDTKKRLSLGAALAGAGAFNVYRNTLGQLILDPVKAVPASEAWLHENSKALASVRRGMEQSAKGQVHDLGDFTKYTQE
jgi:hypothetical protein